jgi:hypothetical protein
MQIAIAKSAARDTILTHSKRKMIRGGIADLFDAGEKMRRRKAAGSEGVRYEYR